MVTYSGIAPATNFLNRSYLRALPACQRARCLVIWGRVTVSAYTLLEKEIIPSLVAQGKQAPMACRLAPACVNFLFHCAQTNVSKKNSLMYTNDVFSSMIKVTLMYY